MSPYIRIFTITLAEYFVYRLNFLLWRMRTVLILLIRYFLWLAVFGAGGVVFGYTKSQMLTYILLSSVIMNFVLSTKTGDIAGEIVQGKIINYVLKPISFFKYQITKDFSDKLLNLAFTVIEMGVLIIWLKPDVFIQTNPIVYLYMLIFIVTGAIISFFVNISLSFIGFWTPEVWAPRFIFYMLLMFFSGLYFPLDILPTPIYYAFFLTPFPYLFFLPTRVYLGVPAGELLFFFSMSLVWVFITYWMAVRLWKKGLHQFSFFGR